VIAQKLFELKPTTVAQGCNAYASSGAGQCFADFSLVPAPGSPIGVMAGSH